jgi:hypothetical protein
MDNGVSFRILIVLFIVFAVSLGLLNIANTGKFGLAVLLDFDTVQMWNNVLNIKVGYAFNW